MKIIPIISYQMQNQNQYNKKQNVNFKSIRVDPSQASEVIKAAAQKGVNLIYVPEKFPEIVAKHRILNGLCVTQNDLDTPYEILKKPKVYTILQYLNKSANKKVKLTSDIINSMGNMELEKLVESFPSSKNLTSEVINSANPV